MTVVSHSSRKCRRCALASSLGKKQKGFACTIVISPNLSLKFPLPVLIAGPTGTLVTVGMEYPRNDFEP